MTTSCHGKNVLGSEISFDASCGEKCLLLIRQHGAAANVVQIYDDLSVRVIVRYSGGEHIAVLVMLGTTNYMPQQWLRCPPA